MNEHAPFVLAIDQSTQGTKAVLFDRLGNAVVKAARAHRQIVNDRGWVSHDPEEIVTNVIAVARDVCTQAGVLEGEVACVGLSNQRETCLAWDRETRQALGNAIVWHDGRAQGLCARLASGKAGQVERIRELSGLELSPYFSASKMAWLLENLPPVRDAAERGTLVLGTMDSWVAFKLCQGHPVRTEPSNACRTQLLDLRKVAWSQELCDFFGLPIEALPEVCHSDSVFGLTTLGGLFDEPIPLCGVLGDSQAALAAQNCLEPGEMKATYGTGSSVVMQTRERLVRSSNGLVTSIAWDFSGKVSYILEGNINYSGAVVTWLIDDLRLIHDPGEAEDVARRANSADRAVFVPAFTGLGAPWWDGEATGLLTGVTRTTGREEIVRAVLDSIPLQDASLVRAMRADSGFPAPELRADGGPSRNAYLMQLQADLADARVVVSSLTELSAGGAAYVAGSSAGVYRGNAIYDAIERTVYEPSMGEAEREERMGRWKAALAQAMHHPA